MSNLLQDTGFASLSEMLNEPIEQVKEREATALEQLLHANGRRVVVFGCGGLGRRTVESLREIGVEPLALCDNNRALWGTPINGIDVMSVEEAGARFGLDSLFVVAVWNPHHWCGETATQLREAGVRSVTSYLPLYWRFPQTYLQVYLLNDLPSRLYEARDAVLAAEKLWADEASLRIYQANIRWRALGDWEAMPSRPKEDTYFPEDVFRCDQAECIIDCGAYDGDTVRQILSHCGKDLRAIYSLEGDLVSFEKLKAYISTLPENTQKKIHLIHGAVGGERSVVRFSCDGGTGSHIGSAQGIEVQCYTLDSLPIAERVTMIKMDIEGAEFDSILGAREILARDEPLLAICVYHTQADIWRIPLLVHELLPQHRLFVRAFEGDGFQTVLFAVPRDRVADTRMRRG